MLKVSDFLARLDEAEHLDLTNAIGAGLHDARMAAQCVTEPTPQTQDVPQLLAYLTSATRQLEDARYLVRRRT
jgi:hypothetical protein